jgi:1,4-alpha-glucan branching enzyme
VLGKMPGDDWQKRANVRLLFSYMCAHPGKKLMFMGSEFGQWQEWRESEQLDWRCMEDLAHLGLRDCAKELNHLYLERSQFHGSDTRHEGFRWVDLHNADDSVWAFQRLCVAPDAGAPITCLFNGTPVPRDGYTIRVPDAGEYLKIFDSDDVRFGGSGYNRQSQIGAEGDGLDGSPFSLRFDLPPLGAIFFIGPSPK